MSAAYTPGPLTVRVGANGDVGIIATKQKVIADDDIGGALVAECYCEIRRAGEGARAEALANATLYATSPELLEALVQARNVLVSAERHHAGEFQKRIRSAYIKSSAAIAKATGAAS